MSKIKFPDTIHVTFRQLESGKYIIIAYHHNWIKSHAIHGSFPYPKARGIKLDSIGKCFQYTKKYLSNAIMVKYLERPLAKSDHYHGKLDDVSVTGKEE